MGKMRRQRYSRAVNKFLVVRPIRLTFLVTLSPGSIVEFRKNKEDRSVQGYMTDIDGKESKINLRRFQIRGWHQRARIANFGDAGGVAIVESYYARLERRAALRKASPAIDEPDTPINDFVSAIDKDAELSDLESRVVDDQDAVDDQLEIIESKGGWYTVNLEGEFVDKIQGKAALNTWLEENGYEPRD